MAPYIFDNLTIIVQEKINSFPAHAALTNPNVTRSGLQRGSFFKMPFLLYCTLQLLFIDNHNKSIRLCRSLR